MASALNSSDQILCNHILKPWKQIEYPEAWRNLPEVPTKSEICPDADPLAAKLAVQEAWNDYQNEPGYEIPLPKNIIDGPWNSKEDYIGAHYQILREDVVGPLRRAVSEFRQHPDMLEDNGVGIYTHVTFRGIQLSPIGAAFRVEFSNERAGKLIRWDQSKRLVQGSMVAITTQRDNFQSICKVAVIAARPLEGLEQNPPQIDIFWGDDKHTVFDPSEEYIMIESRSSYFEASRHMLEALQKLMTEKFSLAEHIAMVNPIVSAPSYVENHSIMDLSSLVLPKENLERPEAPLTDESLLNIDVLRDFPPIPASGMDSLQMEALKSMLVKKVAIVQGPPGTGKTIVSVAALRVMMANMQPGDPPIIVSAQTNHALDQLLNHILKFEGNILRLGGRSNNENEEIRKRTLYELRQSTKGNVPSKHYLIKSAQRALLNRIEEIQQTMMPLVNFRNIIDVKIFLDRKVITQAQYDSLAGGDWDGDDVDISGFASWLPGDQLEPIIRTPLINSNFELEEGDIEMEQLRDLEAEAGALRQDESGPKEALTGTWLGFTREASGRDTGVEDKEIKKLLQHNKSLHGIPAAKRGDTYRYLVRKLDSKMKRDLKTLLAQYRRDVDNLRIAKWTTNIAMIKHLGIKLIGCTTTGLSKYRGLIAALESRTVLIEEAAETLEGTVIAGMIDSLQQLILVGDHQQLQASCNVKSLEGAPYHMNVSMFERLVNNAIGYVMLNRQRRMIPKIRELLCIEANPFYRNLQDHESVLDPSIRPQVPGMGGCNIFFFYHNWTEGRNADSSSYNQNEAQMIVGHFNHLVLNGVDAEKITILTFYNGQRKTLLHELKKNPQLKHILYFKVFTVDSYQGEENDIIMLSLVRSNMSMNIGFLENKNRLVVALSRARQGLYMYGNSGTLVAGEESENYVGREPLWGPLISHLIDRECHRYWKDGGLPIHCARHDEWTNIDHPDRWVEWQLAGGCLRKCGGTLDCGHPCGYLCHPFDHSTISCPEKCQLTLPCGHECGNNCGENCRCNEADCPHSVPIELQGVTYADVVSRPGVNLDIRLEEDDGYSNIDRPRHSPSRIAGSNGVNNSSSDLERVRAWNSWDGKECDAISTEHSAASATKETENNLPGHVFKEDFKSVTIDSEKRRQKARTIFKRTLDNGTTGEPIQDGNVDVQAKNMVSVTDLEANGQLPADKKALLTTMLSPPTMNQSGSEEDVYNASSPTLSPVLKENYSTISPWKVPGPSKTLLSNLQSATAASGSQKLPCNGLTNSTTNQTPLEEDFDLLSFKEPAAPVPTPINAADFDMFEAQFG